MNYKKLITSFVLLFILCSEALAQNGNYELRNVITPSPTTASLGKYGEIPVSLYTGIPDISIPLYEIRDGSLNLPVSLSYHAGGTKVEEIASPVGLGWTLNAGGVVGREQRGVADEYGGWVTAASDRIANILQSGNQGLINSMTIDVENGIKDGEADIYYYNMNGQSGKFFFDQAGTLRNYPAKNVSITPIGGFYGGGWKIITEDGTVYEFTMDEIVTSITCTGGDSESKTAWYLTKITSSDGKRQISFTYENVAYSVWMFLGETKYFPLNGFGGCLNPGPVMCNGTNLFNTKRLKQIDFAGGYVKFNYNTDREDLSGDKRLDQIEIYTQANQLIKKYDLAYSYFGAGSSSPDEKRLKLTSLTEKSGANSPKPPHVFTYEESIQMPHRLTMATDHWGYYNGKLNSSSIASFEFLNPVTGNPYVHYGADKNANPATMQVGILKKIKYPAGGETEFTYESNTTSDTRIAPLTYDEYYYYALNQSYSTLTSPYETNSFTVPAQGANVKFSVSGLTTSNSYCNYEIFLHCYLIKDNNISSPFGEITDATNGVYINLPAGTYKFRFTFNSCYTGNLNYSITLNSKIPILSELGKRPVGGLRIKQIEDKPGNGGQSVIKKYRYETDFDPTKSSGTLVNFPEYGYILDAERWEGAQGPGDPCALMETCKYLVKQSKTNYPLAASQGSYIGYAHVIEDLEDNGEIRHKYNIFSQPNPPFPFAPLEYSEWQLGAEISTKYYAKKNGQLVLSKETGYGYASTNLEIVKGYKVGRNFLFTGSCSGASISAPLTFYDIIPQFWAVNSTIERVYDQNDPTKYIETTTKNTYHPNHLQVTQINTSTSSSDPNIKDEVVVSKKYPQDYSFTGSPSGFEAPGIKKLQDLHIVNVPIEEYSYRQKRNISTNTVSDQRVVGGMITTFKYDNPYPAEVFRLETNATIPLSTYGTGSGISSNSFIKNTNTTVANAYKSAVVFSNYDSYGNLTQQQKANDVITSYLWGYGKSYPVAQVVGSAYTTISSFINQSILDNPSSDIALRNELNKIRTGLSSTKALVSTYTYQPLIGNTSVTDPNNRTNYYYYDAFGRLILIKDLDGKIVKQICYNYWGQTVNCALYGNVQKSQAFTKNDCPPNQPGSQVTYIVPADTYYASTQSEADAQAQSDVNTKGQTYANQTGTCSVPQTTVYINNSTSNTYYLTFYNTATFQNYYHTVNPWGEPTPVLPVGTYNITVTNDGNAYPTWMYFIQYLTFGTTGYFENVYFGSPYVNIGFGD
jgi:YD repeat-containing protein